MPQVRALFVVASLAALPLLSACKSGPEAAAPRAVRPASEAEVALLDRVKSLEGEWVMADESAGAGTASVFAVTSSGSVVREVMFPGQPHEMTNVYHMDGPSLVMTHYCAAGNQPRLRAVPGPSPDVLTFTLDGVSNLTDDDGVYMGGLEMVFKDADHVLVRWTSFRAGEVDHTMDFELARRR